MVLEIKRAVRTAQKIRIALCGPAGSGKTYSALLLARGLVGKNGRILMLDTERGSGSLYADVTEYDTITLDPPYTPERYREAIALAASSGYGVMIIDSLSHAWSGEGGLLDMHDRAAKSSKSGNSFAAWRDITPDHNRMVDAILGAPMHIIGCLRTKTAWEISEDDRGKKSPKKIGTEPIQKAGVEYEFTLVLDLSVDGHVATSTKDRTSIFDGKTEIISVATGEKILGWLNSAAPAPKAEKKASTPQAVEELANDDPPNISHPPKDFWPNWRAEMLDRAKAAGLTEQHFRDIAANRGVKKMSDMTPEKAANIEKDIEDIENTVDKTK